MNPKAAEAWNFALGKLESARQLIDKDEGDLAKTEIVKAVYVGAGALYYLLGQGPEEQAAHEAARGFISDMAAEEIAVTEAYAVACKFLGYVADLSPPEDRFPSP